MSVRSRSYVSAHSCVSVAASRSWVTIRTRVPARRMLPSSKVLTPRRAPISFSARGCCLKPMTEARAITFRARIFESCAITSSVMPSAKSPLSGSAPMLTNGSTAIDFAALASGTTGGVSGAQYTTSDRTSSAIAEADA